MATPTLRVLREMLPGAFIGALVRPGIDQLLSGSALFDELHVGRASGVMGPKRLAARMRPRRYEVALLLPNSFSTALTTRLAGVPQRIGYERDARSFLLTDHLTPPRRRDIAPYKHSTTNPAAWAPIPACNYYFRLATHFLRSLAIEPPADLGPLELATTPDDDLAAAQLLAAAGIPVESQRRTPLALLNPGANDPAKRWPHDRFAALADYLIEHHNMTILVNGSPSERDLVASVIQHTRHTDRIINLTNHAMTLATLKGVIRRTRLVVTNDTGPRHIAAAFSVPVVTLFGPTDRRWTTIPFQDEIEIVADPTLPEAEVANDHPDRCRIENIGLGDVVAAANTLLRNSLAAQNTP